MTTNSYGLSRDIPDGVKREVRQRCGFGCVNCAASIYEYDHFSPEYSAAKKHDPNGITLLCPTCHALKKKGLLTLQQLTERNFAPAACAKGHSSVELPYFENIPSVRLGGGVLISKTLIPIQVHDQPAIVFRPPEPGSKVTRISAFIQNLQGHSVLKIIDNEWIIAGGIWDFEWVGQRMTVKNSSKETVFQLTMFPPNYISIDYMMTNISGHEIRVSLTQLSVDGMVIENCRFDQWEVGLQIGDRSPSLEAKQSGAAVYLAGPAITEPVGSF